MVYTRAMTQTAYVYKQNNVTVLYITKYVQKLLYTTKHVQKLLC